MKKTLTALLLVLCLVLGLMAGCGNSNAEPEAPATEAPAENEPAPPPAEEPNEEPPAEEPEPEGFAPYEWPLPLTEDNVEFEITMMFNPQLSTAYSGYTENTAWDKYQELTGVDFKIVDINAMAIGQQYAMIFASEEYPDIMHSALSYYSTGADAAVEDEVIVDLAPYLEEFAPNYIYWVDKVGAFADITTDKGYRPGFVHLHESPSVTKSGPVTRGDWLEELGLEAPETIDDLHDMLTAMHNEYGAQCAFDASGASFEGAWGTSISIVSFPVPSYPIYQIDGKVIFGPTTDEARDYFTTIKQWIDEGLMYSDFVSVTDNREGLANFCNGTYSYYNGDTDALVSAYSLFSDPNAKITPIPYSVRNKGDVIPFDGYGISNGQLTGQGTFSITTSCEDVELAIKVLDWRYSEAGSFLFNYGVEGIAFEYDENGEPEFLDVVVNNPNGFSAEWLSAIYMDEYAFVQNIHRFDKQMTAEQLEAREIWDANNESIYDLPAGMSLNSEEAEIFANAMSDISSYVSESILKMLTGAMDIETEFDDFVKQIEDMHIQDCIDCYQSAYDRYMQRSNEA